MLRAQTIIAAAMRTTDAAGETITLTREERFRRRYVMRSDKGTTFLLDLTTATYLADGDALSLSDGRLIVVRAADEPLLEICASDKLVHARLAWHLGNRHTPCEITPDALYIRPDHVLEELAQRLGATVRAVERPFDPEGGAYGHKGSAESGHHHGHSHDHGHAHG